MSDQPSKKIPPKLTVKQAKFVKGVASGMPKYKAAMAAYDTKSPTIAATIASETIRKPNVQEALAIALDKHGITLDKAVAPIAKALEAKKQVWHGQDSNEAWVEEVEDVELQLKGSDRALRLMGVGDKGQTININFGNVAQAQKEEFGL